MPIIFCSVAQRLPNMLIDTKFHLIGITKGTHQWSFHLNSYVSYESILKPCHMGYTPNKSCGHIHYVPVSCTCKRYKTDTKWHYVYNLWSPAVSVVITQGVAYWGEAMIIKVFHSLIFKLVSLSKKNYWSFHNQSMDMFPTYLSQWALLYKCNF